MQRYTVNLSNFFSDHRQKVFIGRRPQWKHIACLLEHIRSVFLLDSHIYLTNSEKIFYPEGESLDVIQKGDQLIAHSSNSSSDTQQIGAPKKAADGESRVTVVNGKRKRDSPAKLNPEKFTKKVEESDSDSDSDDDVDDNALPKIFLESMSRQNESTQELPKPIKRKRIRKRKTKKVASETPPKVVVKTYGKSKVPAIVTENGTRSNHVRFDNDKKINDETDSASPAKNEPYRNLNKITVPRVIKAVVQSSPTLTLNNETPRVPDYVFVLPQCVPSLNSSAADATTHKPQSNPEQLSEKRKSSLEIKKEQLDANTTTEPERPASPTWDSELSDAKEAFLATYSGEIFWATLQEALDNFPSITIPSVNDIVAYRIDAQLYLSLVERVVDGESDDKPALKLTMRRLNGGAPSSATAPATTVSVTLDQLTEIRLIATYQP